MLRKQFTPYVRGARLGKAMATGAACLVLSGCFGPPGRPLTPAESFGCVAAAPICAYQRAETTGQAVGRTIGATLIYPVALAFVAVVVVAAAEAEAHNAEVETCHQHGGNYICEEGLRGTVCRCVTVE
jgi:hypothetical protein